MIFNYLFFDLVLRSEVIFVPRKYGRLADLLLECIVEVERLRRVLILISMLESFFRRFIIHKYLEVGLKLRLFLNGLLILHPNVVVETGDKNFFVI